MSAARTESPLTFYNGTGWTKTERVCITSKALLIWAIFHFFSQSKRCKKISNFKSRFKDGLVCRLELDRDAASRR